MRLPRLRVRLLTLLIVVIVAGLAVLGWQLWKRRQYCLAEAARHEAGKKEAEFALANLAKLRRDLRNMLDHETERARTAPDDQKSQRAARLAAIEPKVRKDLRRIEDVIATREAEARRSSQLAPRFRYVADHPWMSAPPVTE